MIRMAFHVRNSETEKLVRALAQDAKVGLTEAVHLAVEAELIRRKRTSTFTERTAEICRTTAARVKHPEPLPKSFYDDLYE
jgi:antitoxin VapB